MESMMGDNTLFIDIKPNDTTMQRLTRSFSKVCRRRIQLLPGYVIPRCSTSRSPRIAHQFSSSTSNGGVGDSLDLGPNPGLASVIAQGIKSLEENAADVEARTRNKSIKPQSNQPTHRQLAEAQRIQEVASDCLEDLCLRYQKEGGTRDIPGLHLQGQPIVLLHVQVNKDIKQAKIYWALPYDVLLDPNVNQRIYQRLAMVLQKQLEGGGTKILAKEVSSRLRHYYPPRIRLVPATDAMIEQAISEFHS